VPPAAYRCVNARAAPCRMPNVRERASSGVESKMAPKQNALGLVDASRKVRRPPLIGIQFLHEDPAGPEADVGVVRDNARHSNSKPAIMSNV
jgi:hypothetical protein